MCRLVRPFKRVFNVELWSFVDSNVDYRVHPNNDSITFIAMHLRMFSGLLCMFCSPQIVTPQESLSNQNRDLSGKRIGFQSALYQSQ